MHPVRTEEEKNEKQKDEEIRIELMNLKRGFLLI